MSVSNNRSRSWLVILTQCAAGLLLYITTSFTVGLLSGSPVLGAAVSGPLVLGAVVAWRRWTFGAWSSQPASGKVEKTEFWAIVMVGLVLCFLGGQTLAVSIYTEYGSPTFDAAQSSRDAVPVVVLLLALVVAAPAGEEALMRGLIYPLLRLRLPVLSAALMSSTMFAALHGNPVQIAVALPLGMLLAFVYEHVRRICPVIALHALFNLASVLVPVHLVEAVATPAVFSIALVGTASILILLHPSHIGVDHDKNSSSPE
ncbi:CPBP family intramembrane glutamic endopeptidase [Nocardiopsis synnemataformans]|uniref:CPBP family intramembrane glutamic endopeptidase n=1 Tax=Nocardiopsis synnemataformans TaxID=61305 RepID=UPI003EBE3D17